MNKFTAFFAAYNASVKRGNPHSYAEMVSNFTGGKTQSLRDLNLFELQELTRQINNLIPEDKGKADRMRKAIIAIFKKMNRTTADAISWAEKQGVRGNKKKFNDYTTGELFVLISVAEKVLNDWQNAIRKKIETI